MNNTDNITPKNIVCLLEAILDTVDFEIGSANYGKKEEAQKLLITTRKMIATLKKGNL